MAVFFAFSPAAVAQNLFDAVDKGDIEKIKILITDDPGCINQKEEKSGFTPLHQAASNGQTDICKLLIEKGADIHAADNLQRTALHLLSRQGA